jgi:outer membrane protein assembly factor BamB
MKRESGVTRKSSPVAPLRCATPFLFGEDLFRQVRRLPARCLVVFFIAAGITFCSSAVRAECQDDDWPQWRGPGRDGVSGQAQLPRDWLKKELAVRWRVPLGEGYATPLVLDDRVYTFGREQTSEVIQSHDLRSGKVRWRVAYPAKYEAKELKGAHGAGPRATPIVHDGRVFAFGINEVLTCVDASSGRIRWRVDFPKRFHTEPPGYGASSSPMISGRRILVAAGQHLFALDYRSGSVIWRALDDSFYSSVIDARLANRDLVVAFARYRLLGLNPQDGRVWWHMSYPSMFGSNIATPVVWRDRVVVSSSSQGTRAVRVSDRRSRVAVSPAWHTKNFKAYLTSPVVHKGHLYGLDEGGMLFCLNLENGHTVWSGGNFSDFGTLMLVGDQLLILTGYGELTAVEATPAGYRELGQQQVARSATWAPAVVARGCLLIRDKKELTCFELPAGSDREGS